MRSKGMMYTSFALLASSVILLVAFVGFTGPVSDESTDYTRVNEASFFLESMLDDMDRTLEMSTRRALSSTTNYVISNGEGADDPGPMIMSALVNGTIDETGSESVSMENASLNSWAQKIQGIASGAGYQLTVELIDYGFNSSGLEIKPRYTIFSRLEDPVTRTAFNKTNTADITVSVEGLEDTMITLQSNEEYFSNYRRCSFDDPAEKLHEASTHSEGVFYGSASVEPSGNSEVSDIDERILVVDDIEAYSDEEGDFAGVVSADSSNDVDNQNYATGTTIGDIEQGMYLTVYNGSIWRTGFRQMLGTDGSQGCYVSDSEGPTFLDRLQNKMVSDDDSEGVATLINLEELSEASVGRSTVGYIYFNSSDYRSTSRIHGITDEYSWFRLDDDHIEEWGIEELEK